MASLITFFTFDRFILGLYITVKNDEFSHCQLDLQMDVVSALSVSNRLAWNYKLAQASSDSVCISHRAWLHDQAEDLSHAEGC
jgi:hypothetical protein